jgi:iron complex outermembrane receptor protein
MANFSLKVSPNAVIVIKYVGYKPQEISVAGNKNIVVKLEEDVVALGEVVAIGYGTVKKTDATGSITAIKPDAMNKGQVTNAQDMLLGKIAGVNITTGGGTPGTGATIRIRGVHPSTPATILSLSLTVCQSTITASKV